MSDVNFVKTMESAYWDSDLGKTTLRDVPMYTDSDSSAFFYSADMSIDVDGSPIAYAPGDKPPHPGAPQPLDVLKHASIHSKRFIQGNRYWVGDDPKKPDSYRKPVSFFHWGKKKRITAKGPNSGYFVSASALTFTGTEPWNAYEFVDAAEIPYTVFPHPSKFDLPSNTNTPKPNLGDFIAILDLQNLSKVTFGIIADTNDEVRVGESSLAAAYALGRNDLSASNGEDNIRYFHLIFPGRPYRPQQNLPHWDKAEIQLQGRQIFEDWGGEARVNQIIAELND